LGYSIASDRSASRRPLSSKTGGAGGIPTDKFGRNLLPGVIDPLRQHDPSLMTVGITAPKWRQSVLRQRVMSVDSPALARTGLSSRTTG
jgi:hypothetical protein